MIVKKTFFLTSTLVCLLGCPSENTAPKNTETVETKTKKDSVKQTIVDKVVEEITEKEYVPSPIPFLAEPGYLIVEGESVDPKRFNKKMELLGAFSRVIEPDQLQQFVDRTIEDLVNETLFRKVANNQEVDQKEVDAKLQEIKSSTSNFERHLEKLGQSETELRKEVEDSMKTTAYVDSLITISETEMKALYKRNARNFRKPAQIRVSHIFFEVEKPADKKAAQKKASEVLKKVREPGANFGDLAKKYSAGPTKQKKGDLGWFSRKQLLPRFSKAAFALKKGSVSKPVWTERGYHLIKVFDKKPAETQSFKSVKADLLKTLQAKKRGDTIREIIRKSKKNGGVKIDQKKIVKNPDFKYAEGIRKSLPTEIKTPKKK